jgi:hypothetical protein
MSGTTSSASTGTSGTAKTQQVAAIISALQTQGTQMSDDDLNAIQAKTDALATPEDVIHIDSGSTHIHVAPHAATQT